MEESATAFTPRPHPPMANALTELILIAVGVLSSVFLAIWIHDAWTERRRNAGSFEDALLRRLEERRLAYEELESRVGALMAEFARKQAELEEKLAAAERKSARQAEQICELLEWTRPYRVEPGEGGRRRSA